MGTNYYIVKKASERKEDLNDMIAKLQTVGEGPGLDREVENIVEQFYEEKGEVHLGKNSHGWKFGWNFHNGKYYSSKQELIDFVKSAGVVVDEYGEEHDAEEFLSWALNKEGWTYGEEYVKHFYDDKGKSRPFTASPKYFDLEIDGLRVSSSTDFC